MHKTIAPIDTDHVLLKTTQSIVVKYMQQGVQLLDAHGVDDPGSTRPCDDA